MLCLLLMQLHIVLSGLRWLINKKPTTTFKRCADTVSSDLRLVRPRLSLVLMILPTYDYRQISLGIAHREPLDQSIRDNYALERPLSPRVDRPT